MYVCLGGDIFVPPVGIVGLFDLDDVTVQAASRQYLKEAERNKQIVYTAPYELPKSLILYGDDNQPQIIYISHLSVATLFKRMRQML